MVVAVVLFVLWFNFSLKHIHNFSLLVRRGWLFSCNFQNFFLKQVFLRRFRRQHISLRCNNFFYLVVLGHCNFNLLLLYHLCFIFFNNFDLWLNLFHYLIINLFWLIKVKLRYRFFWRFCITRLRWLWLWIAILYLSLRNYFGCWGSLQQNSSTFYLLYIFPIVIDPNKPSFDIWPEFLQIGAGHSFADYDPIDGLFDFWVHIDYPFGALRPVRAARA